MTTAHKRKGPQRPPQPPSPTDDDSPHSAPPMSISLFLEDSPLPPAPSPLPIPPPRRRRPPKLPKSLTPTPVIPHLLTPRSSHPAPPPTELYCQSNDIIFVIPTPPSLPTHRVDVYSLSAMTFLLSLRGHDSPVSLVYRTPWCEASDLLFTQTQSGTVYQWVLSTGELVERFEGGSEWLSALLMTRRLTPLPLVSRVSDLQLEGGAVEEGSGGDSPHSPSSLTSLAVVYENQRFYPLLGWSARLLPTDRPPWSNGAGTKARGKGDYPPSDKWRWLDDWEVVRDDTTDVDGWSYAIDFNARGGAYRGLHRPAFLHSVRRRRWERHRGVVTQPTAVALASESMEEYIGQRQGGSPAKEGETAPPKRRKAKGKRPHRLTAGEGARPKAHSTASDQGAPTLLPSPRSPSPPLAVRQSSATPPPHLLPPKTKGGSTSTPSSPNPLSAMLQRVKIQPDELKQTLRRILLSHEGSERGRRKTSGEGGRASPMPRGEGKGEKESKEAGDTAEGKGVRGKAKASAPTPPIITPPIAALPPKAHQRHPSMPGTIRPTPSVSSTRVEVWENQRHYPVLGWSSRLLPTDPYPPSSDASGHLFTFTAAELQLGDMEWVNDWEVVRGVDTDGEGWLYAVDWQWEFAGRERVLTTVRRRRWVRDKRLRMQGPSIETLQVRRKGGVEGRRRTTGGLGGGATRLPLTLFTGLGYTEEARRGERKGGRGGSRGGGVTASPVERRHSRSHSYTVEGLAVPEDRAGYDPRAGEPEDL